MAGCDDSRQLTEQQRQDGYQQQRTGVQQAVRPFTGKPTAENLADYINRELFPAVKATRKATNDIYLQVADNAPSANPLAFYFSVETAAADPTAGRVRLDASPQNTSTTIRISEDNARLQDVVPWLDVMSGGATTPLGVITIFDAVNPARFLRFDLTSMTDQGTYWDLGVSIVESSHIDPFVADEAIVLSFIPGVSSAGSTVPPGSLSPIAANTVLGNATASTAPPTAIPLGTLSVLGRSAGNITAVTAATGGGRALYLRTNDTTTAISWATISEASLPLLLDGYIYANMTGATSAPLGKPLSAMAGPGLKFNSSTPGDYQYEVRFPGAPIYDVMDAPFNASGSLAGDDTAALTAAIDAANLVPGTIYLGPAHRITSALPKITGNNIRVMGRGAFNGGTILQVDTASAVDVFSFYLCQYSSVERLWIVGTRVFTGGWGIKFDGTFRCYSEDVVISSMAFGVEALNSVFTECRRTHLGDLYGAFGFLAHGTGGFFNHAARYEGCVCGTDYPATVVGAARVWAPGLTVVIGNIVFANSAIYQAVSAGTTGGTAPIGSGTTAATAHTTVISDGAVNWVFAMPLNVWFLQDSAAHTFEVIDCGTLQGGYGLAVTDTAGTLPLFTRVQNFQVDHPFTAGIQLDAGAAARMNQVFVTSVLEGSGVVIGSGHSGGWEIIGGEVFGTAKAGVVIQFGYGALADVQIGGCGLASVGTRDCIEVSSSAGHWRVLGCHAGALIGTTTGSRYGVSIAAGCDNYIVEGNDLSSNLTGAVLNTPGLSTTRIVRNNIPDTTSSVPDGDYGDITVSVAGTVWNIDPGVVGTTEIANDSVTFAKIQNIGYGVLGNPTFATTTDPSLISPSGGFQVLYDNNAGALVWATLVTGNYTNASVTDAKISNRTALSVFGRTANSAGVGADIAATAASGAVLRESGSGLSFGTVATAGIANDAVTFAKIQNIGYGVIGFPTFGGSGDPQLIAPPGSFTILQDDGTGVLAFRSLATTSIVHGALGVFQRAALTGDVTAAQNSNATTIATAAVTLAKMADLAQSRIIGRADGAGTGVPQALTPAQVATIVQPEITGALIARTFYASGSGNHVMQATTSRAVVKLQGGGGGGGGFMSSGVAAGAGMGGGGASGSFLELNITSNLGTHAYACGAAGVGVSALPGTAGGDTTFHDGAGTRTAGGGGYGMFATASTTSQTSFGGYDGGLPSATGAFIRTSGQVGKPGLSFSLDGANFGFGGDGGNGFFGGGGKGRHDNDASGNGFSALGPGSGGGGAYAEASTTNRAGGDGAAGWVLVEEYS